MRAFENMHPMATSVYFLSVIITVMFIQNPIIQLTGFAAALLFLCLIRTFRRALKETLWLWPLLVLSAVINPLISVNGSTHLFTFFGRPYYLEALLYGLGMGFMLTGTIVWFQCLSVFLSGEKLSVLFGRYAPRLGIVLSVSLGMIPNFIRRTHEIIRAQKLLYPEGGKGRVKSAFDIFTVLISRSLEDAVQTGDAMKARGYGTGNFKSISPYRFGTLEIAFTAVSLVLLTTTLMCVSDFSYYPTLSPISCDFRDITAYTAFFMLIFIPIFTDIKERIQWKYCVSKI